MDHRCFHVDKKCLGLVFAVGIFAKTGPLCFRIEPFDIAAAPQKGGEIEAGFRGRGPDGFVGLPPFGQSRCLLVLLVKVFSIILGLIIGKLIGDNVVVTGIQACKRN